MENNKKWVSRECRFRPEDYKELLKIKELSGRPISHHIRTAISEYIKKRKAERNKGQKEGSLYGIYGYNYLSTT